MAAKLIPMPATSHERAQREIDMCRYVVNQCIVVHMTSLNNVRHLISFYFTLQDHAAPKHSDSIGGCSYRNIHYSPDKSCQGF